MFDKHIHTHKAESVPYAKTVTIHEHKAPTDESVKLLNEFTEKAKSNIIKNITVESNHLKAVVICYSDDVMSQSYEFHMKFNLNGEDYHLKDRIKFRDIRDGMPFDQQFGLELNRKQLIELIHSKFAALLVAELLAHDYRFVNNMLKGGAR